MGSRRNLARLLWGLATVAYGFVVVASLFSPIYLSGLDRPFNLLDQALFAAVTVVAGALTWALGSIDRRRFAIVLFAAWFVLAAIAAIAIELRWGVALALTGLLPLFLVFGELRTPASPATGQNGEPVT